MRVSKFRGFMTVYIVTCTTWESSNYETNESEKYVSIEKVFCDEDKAKAYVKEQNKNKWGMYSYDSREIEQ